MTRFLISFLLIGCLAIAGINAQGSCLGGVPFCNSIQILTGQCSTECATPSTTPRTSTTRRPRSTTPGSGSTCESGVSFCPTVNPNSTANATECLNGAAPFQLSWTTLGTLLQTQNASAAGVSGGMVASLGNYFTSLGSSLSRQ